MQLHSLFQRYLRECNYVEDLDATDVIQQLALQTFKPVPYGYDDIPQLYPDDVSMLFQKRDDGSITQMEEAQLDKYCFQNLILDVNPKVKSVLWDLYIQHGDRSFVISLSRGHSIRALSAFMPSSAATGMLIVLLTMPSLCNVRQFKRSGPCSGSVIVTTSTPSLVWKGCSLLAPIYSSMSRESGQRLGCDRDEQPNVPMVPLATSPRRLNQILLQWGFSKLQRQERKRKRSAGVQLDASVYGLRRYPEVEVDVYEHIRPATT